jgi:hypothetical protein
MRFRYQPITIDEKGYRWAKVLSSSFWSCFFGPFKARVKTNCCGMRVRNVRSRKNVTNSENFVTNSGKLRYELGKFPLITLASLHAATISLDSSLKRAERNKTKMMTTIPLPTCNLFHLCLSLTISLKCGEKVCQLFQIVYLF